MNEIGATGQKLVSLVKNCINVSTPPISANPLVLLGTYLKKAAIVKEILITAGTFNSLINNDFVKKVFKETFEATKKRT